MHPGDREYRNETVQISALVVTNEVIQGITFTNCSIQGPAIVVPVNGTLFSRCIWESDPLATFWAIDEDRPGITGAVILDHCELYGCRLTRIGVAVPRSRLAEARAQIG